MKKIFMFLALIVAALSFTSCEEMIQEGRVSFENSVITIERAKIPFRINEYNANGIAVKAITIDTVVMTYESSGNMTPSWGYIKTTWAFPTAISESYSFLHDDDDLYGTEKKEILVELTNLASSNGHVEYKANWPKNPFQENKLLTDDR